MERPPYEELKEDYNKLDKFCDHLMIEKRAMEFAHKVFIEEQAKKEFELKEEIKQLKKEIEELKKCYKNNSTLLDFEETNTTKLVNKVMKLEEILTEIKKFARGYIGTCSFSWRCKECIYGCWANDIMKKCEVLNDKAD